MNVYEKLQKARIQLQSASMKKSGHNKFAGYQYFELGDFLPEINKIFAELGLCSAVSFGKELAELKVINIEKPEEVVTFTSPMAEANLKGCHPIQNLGAVETYNRRYLYVTALEIVEHDALDAAPPIDKQIDKVTEAVIKADIKPLNMKGNVTEAQKKKIDKIHSSIVDLFNAEQDLDAYAAYKDVNDADEKAYLWSVMDKGTKKNIERVGKSLTPALADQA